MRARLSARVQAVRPLRQYAVLVCRALASAAAVRKWLDCALALPGRNESVKRCEAISTRLRSIVCGCGLWRHSIACSCWRWPR